MFEVVPLGNGAGSIWLLGTDLLVEDAKWGLLRCCREWVERLQRTTRS
jgi:hypothetical protein